MYVTATCLRVQIATVQIRITAGVIVFLIRIRLEIPDICARGLPHYGVVQCS